MSPVGLLVNKFGRWYLSRLCRRESEGQEFSHWSERPIEYRFALQALTGSLPKTVLDVGSGRTSWPHLLRTCGFVVTACDNIRDYWPRGMINRHWNILDIDITNPKGLKTRFDAVVCISVLEHIVDHEKAMKAMLALLNPGGRLILTCPYNENEYCENVYKRADALYGQEYPFICRSYSRAELERWLDGGAVVESKELWKLFTGPVWATGQRISWEIATENTPHQLGCFVIKR